MSENEQSFLYMEGDVTFYVTTVNGYYVAGPMTAKEADAYADAREDATGQEYDVVMGAENVIGAPDND